MKKNEKIKLCHVCGSKNIQEEMDTVMCLSCGFHTHPMFKFEKQEELEATMPKLIKALKFSDKRINLFWYPIVINLNGIGILFPDGNSADDWHWNFSKIVPIPLHERLKYPIPGKENEFYETRLDVENAKIFQHHEFEKAYKEFLEYVKTR